MLCDPAAKTLFGQTWAAKAQRMVSRFRSTHDMWPGDAAFAALVGRVRVRCLAFDEWWAPHGVGAPVFGTEHLHHPTLGLVRYEYANRQANDDPALKLSLHARC